MRMFTWHRLHLQVGGIRRLVDFDQRRERLRSQIDKMQFDIRRLDIYRKVPKDLTQPTLTGALISVCSVLFILFLFMSELSLFISTDLHSELTVDDPVKHSEKIPVYINITLMKMGCDYLGLDIQDDMGRHEVGFKDNTVKTPFSEGGCRFESHFLINKVPGNFHVSTHSARQQPDDPDMSHIVHKVRFGMDLAEGKEVKGSFNPLENVDKSHADPISTHDYILRVVPTVYEDISGNIRFPYQYTYSSREMIQYHHGGRAVPAIWFRYELSPITVRYKEKRPPFYTFLTTATVWAVTVGRLLLYCHLTTHSIVTATTTHPLALGICAIVGGTFTVAGIVDALVFSAAEIIKKAELGKLS